MVTVNRHKKPSKLVVTENDLFNSEYLEINGIHDYDSTFSLPYEAENIFLNVRNNDVKELLVNETFESLGNHFSIVSITDDVDFWDDSEIETDIFCSRYFEKTIPSIRLSIRINYDEWAKPWSINDFSKAFRKISEQRTSGVTFYQEDEENDNIFNGFGIYVYCQSNNLVILHEIRKAHAILKACISDTNKLLLKNIDSNSLVVYFNFPKEIQIVCSQYLTYFTQFLRDIGIEANSEVINNPSETLLKITPISKQTALQNIQELLNVYLSTPNLNNIDIPYTTDIAARQWVANIYHLKSQLTLAHSIIQAKDATIEALKLSNYQYKQLVTSDTDHKSEDLIENIVTIKEYKGNGFSINLPEILKRLKRLF